MFTDRFIKVPIQLFYKAAKELTGKEDCEMSWLKINPFDISEYRPSYDNDDSSIERVAVFMKNGDQSLVFLTIEEFESLLNNNDATDNRLR